MESEAARRCYTDEWKRTDPDFVVYLPGTQRGSDGYGDHFLVESTPGGDLLAMWTMSAVEGALNSRVVCARSEDEGRTWSAPQQIVGALSAEETQAAFAIPVMSRSGRIYCLYNVDKGIYDAGPRISAMLGCHVSDDDGRSWQDSGIEIPYGRTRYDHPDPKVPCNCIIWQKPVRDAEGRPIAPFTRGSSIALYPRTPPDFNFMTRGGTAARGSDGHGGLMRFDNIDGSPEPADIEITWLPREDGALSYPHAMELARAQGYSCFHEPSVAVLPDGRLFVAASSLSGHLIHAVSDDAEATGWRAAEPLRYRDDGTELLHPVAPALLYGLEDGRFLVFYHGHDGRKYGGLSPNDTYARRPMCVSLGEYRPNAHQPIWFSQPRVVCDTDGVAAGPEPLIWLAMYASMTERDGRRILWYPDRKHFLLGRLITDEFLSEMAVPS